MAPNTPRLRILSVGGNAVSAFLSWRLQATNACDVTLVWKSGFDAVSQYGISFKSAAFGNERFKPRHVVRTPEDAASGKDGAFDYVLLCVKALPDVYDLAAVIESVVTPQHTCILVNTTHTLGVEAHLEQRFPTNVVLSLVSGAEIAQLGASEFEHKGTSEVYVGPANKNAAIPASIQQDMAEALAMTLSTGQVECKVSLNIRQQQYERMIGPIAFHPISVLMETPSHSALLEKAGVRSTIEGVIDELLSLAEAMDCQFPADFKQKVMSEMVASTETNSIMYQDYAAKRPMEVETYLGSPIKLGESVGLKVPRIETLYTLLHNLNIVNQQRPKETPVGSPTNTVQPPPRMSSVPPMRGGPMMNGNGRGRGRAPSMQGAPPPGVRRPMNGGPPNGYGRPMTNGYGAPPGPHGQQSRRGSMDGNDLEEFSHLVLYDNPDGGDGGGGGDLALRERELMLRQRELALKEQEMRMRGGRLGPVPRSRAPSVRHGGGGGGFDDDDEDDYFDPQDAPPVPMIDPDNFDMMSVTSRRTRKQPSASQMRKNPELDMGGPPSRGRGAFGRPMFSRNRSSARLMADVPGLHDSLMNDPLLGYSSNRYGNVDRAQMGNQSRTNSLTAERLDELQYGHAGPNGQGGAYPRRASQSPGAPLSPYLGRENGRPSPPNGPNGYMGPRPNGMPNGMAPPNGIGSPNGRPSPPGGVRQPVPRYPPGQGNSVAPQQVEQHAGVSHLHPNKGPVNQRNLTGSASASAGSGDSGASAVLDSENSAHSSQSSFGPRPPIGVR